MYMPKLVFVFLCMLVLHLVYILWFKSEPRKNYDTPPCLPLGLDDGLKCKIQTRSAHHSCSMRFYCSKHCCHQFFFPTRHVESVMGAHAPQIFISSKCHRGLFHWLLLPPLWLEGNQWNQLVWHMAVSHTLLPISDLNAVLKPFERLNPFAQCENG